MKRTLVERVVMLHIGRKVPKGWEELPGSIHIGANVWIMRMRRHDRQKGAGK